MSETGTLVVEVARDGQFDSCQKRTGICNYACCGFGTLGNFISPLVGEIEMAQEQGLSFDHLKLEEMEDGSTRIHCQRVCKPGEFKSLDCGLYPMFIASPCGTKFIVADNRKCPIPHNELMQLARTCQDVAVGWELKHPGTLERMAKDGADFRAYQPFGFQITFDGKVVPLSTEEMKAITPKVLLDDKYIAKFSGVELDGYSGRTTPEDQEVDVDSFNFPPLKSSAAWFLANSKECSIREEGSSIVLNEGLRFSSGKEFLDHVQSGESMFKGVTSVDFGNDIELALGIAGRIHFGEQVVTVYVGLTDSDYAFQWRKVGVGHVHV